MSTIPPPADSPQGLRSAQRRLSAAAAGGGTRIGLSFRRLPDVELLHRGISHVRLFCTVEFETLTNEVFVQPAIVDTGAPLCLIPSDLWKLEFD